MVVEGWVRVGQHRCRVVMWPGLSSSQDGSGWRRGRRGTVVASWKVVVDEEECPDNEVGENASTSLSHCRCWTRWGGVGGEWDASEVEAMR